MTRAVIAILGLVVLVAAGFVLASGLSASANGAGRSPLAAMDRQAGSGSGETADQSGAVTGTDRDCPDDQQGNQPAAGGASPDHGKKKCPPPAVPEVPVAAGLLGLLGLIGLGFVVVAGRPRPSLSGSP